MNESEIERALRSYGIPPEKAKAAAERTVAAKPARKPVQAAPGPKKGAKTEAGVFAAWCKKHGLPRPFPEFRFAPPRRWRFDFAFDNLIAIEVEGGVWTQGRHTRGAGFLADCEKYNEAAIRGWCVIRVTPDSLCTATTADYLHRAMRAR